MHSLLRAECAQRPNKALQLMGNPLRGLSAAEFFIMRPIVSPES